jgi:hypothetical protein
VGALPAKGSVAKFWAGCISLEHGEPANSILKTLRLVVIIPVLNIAFAAVTSRPERLLRLAFSKRRELLPEMFAKYYAHPKPTKDAQQYSSTHT